MNFPYFSTKTEKQKNKCPNKESTKPKEKVYSFIFGFGFGFVFFSINKKEISEIRIMSAHLFKKKKGSIFL